MVVSDRGPLLSGTEGGRGTPGTRRHPPYIPHLDPGFYTPLLRSFLTIRLTISLMYINRLGEGFSRKWLGWVDVVAVVVEGVVVVLVWLSGEGGWGCFVGDVWMAASGSLRVSGGELGC